MDEFAFTVEQLTRGVLVSGEVYGTQVRIAGTDLQSALTEALQEATEHWRAGNSDRRFGSLRVGGVLFVPGEA